MYIELDKIKKHLNIDPFYNDDNGYLIFLYEVAEEVVSRHIDSDLNEIADRNNGELPKPLLQAILLYIGDMYLQREAVSSQNMYNVPFSYDYILSLYNNYYPSKFKTEI